MIYHTHGQRSLYFPNCELCISVPFTSHFNTIGTPSVSFFNIACSPIKMCILTQTKIYSKHNHHHLSESGCQKLTNRNQYSQFSPFYCYSEFCLTVPLLVGRTQKHKIRNRFDLSGIITAQWIQNNKYSTYKEVFKAVI